MNTCWIEIWLWQIKDLMSSEGNELHVELPKEQSKSLKTGQVPTTSHQGRVDSDHTSLHLDLPMHIVSDNCEIKNWDAE